MGKIIKLMTIALLLALSACTEHMVHTEYRYINNSGAYIKMYDADDSKLIAKIADGETYVYMDRTRGSSIPFPMIIRSIKIIFNNECYLLFKRSENTEGNLFYLRSYTEISTDSELTYIFEYVFTPEHYERAEPLDP